MKVRNVCFFEDYDYMIFETNASEEELLKWAKNYLETFDIENSRPQCSTWKLIFDTLIDNVGDDKERGIKIDLKIDLNKLYKEMEQHLLESEEE